MGAIIPWKELIRPRLSPFSLGIGISTWEIWVVQSGIPSVSQGENEKGFWMKGFRHPNILLTQ